MLAQVSVSRAELGVEDNAVEFDEGTIKRQNTDEQSGFFKGTSWKTLDVS
jgi:hypothetical protein